MCKKCLNWFEEQPRCKGRVTKISKRLFSPFWLLSWVVVRLRLRTIHFGGAEQLDISHSISGNTKLIVIHPLWTVCVYRVLCLYQINRRQQSLSPGTSVFSHSQKTPMFSSTGDYILPQSVSESNDVFVSVSCNGLWPVQVVLPAFTLLYVHWKLDFKQLSKTTNGWTDQCI